MIPLGKGRLHIRHFGSGPELLIAFHGFGEDGSRFEVLMPSLSSRFHMVSVDLPFHGYSEWPQGKVFSMDDLYQLIRMLLVMHSANRFSMLGYSLGAKFVLAAIPEFATQIIRIILVAPDGIKTNAWYNLAVYPQWGQWLFRRFVKKPAWVFNMARLLRFTRLLDDRLFRFLQAQTDSEEKRQQIHDSWMAAKALDHFLHATTLDRLRLALNENGIHLYLFTGLYDRVITPETGRMLATGLNHCQFKVLEKGHNLITESLNEELNLILPA